VGLLDPAILYCCICHSWLQFGLTIDSLGFILGLLDVSYEVSLTTARYLYGSRRPRQVQETQVVPGDPGGSRRPGLSLIYSQIYYESII
jgi:hypothetical protein